MGNMDKSSCLSTVFIILATNVGIQSIRLVSINVPSSVMMGDPVWLNCTVDYEENSIYSIKWYKGDDEFYRYLPAENSPNQIYDLPGIYLDLSKSSEGQVYLNTTDNNTDGMYKCEASAEGPLFQTVEAVKELTVYALPDEPPTMLEPSSTFDIGQELNATCISAPSKPAAKLTWYINGEPAPKHFQTRRPPIDQPGGLQSSSVLLRFKVTREHSPRGHPINLRCESTVSERYAMKTAVLVIGDKTPPTEPPESTEANDTTPTISGSQGSYRTGDLLSINCTSAKALPAPRLLWLINYSKAPTESLVPYSTIVDDDGLETTILGLRFVVERKHFDSTDIMKLKCTSTLSRIIDTRSVEKILESSGGEEPWAAENREAESVKGTGNEANSAQVTMRTWGIVLLTLLPFL